MVLTSFLMNKRMQCIIFGGGSGVPSDKARLQVAKRAVEWIHALDKGA